MKKLLSKLSNIHLGIKASFAFMMANFLEKITMPIFIRILTEEAYGQISYITYCFYLKYNKFIF